MTASFTVYIDESGDEGFTFLPNEQGSSRWLVLSAVVFPEVNDPDAVNLMRHVRTVLNKQHKQALHFRDLKHEHRVPYARAIGEARLRTVSVLIHRPSIKEPERFQSEKFRLYRYATQLLLERVSWLCRDHRKKDEGDGTAKITFSNRSMMSYDALRTYLQHLREISGGAGHPCRLVGGSAGTGESCQPRSACRLTNRRCRGLWVLLRGEPEPLRRCGRSLCAPHDAHLLPAPERFGRVWRQALAG